MDEKLVGSEEVDNEDPVGQHHFRGLDRKKQAHIYTTGARLGLPFVPKIRAASEVDALVPLTRKVKNKRLEPALEAKNPEQLSLPYDLNQLKNKNRVEVEEIIKSFESDDPPVMTIQLQSRLQRELVKWVMNTGAQRSIQKNRYLTTELRNMNERRQKVVEKFKVVVAPQSSLNHNDQVPQNRIQRGSKNRNKTVSKRKKKGGKANKNNNDKLQLDSSSSSGSDGKSIKSLRKKLRFSPSASRSSTPVPDSFSIPIPSTDIGKADESIVEIFGLEFLNLEKLQTPGLSTGPNCGRSDSYRALLAPQTAFAEGNNGFLWRVFKTSNPKKTRPAAAVHLTKHNYFKKSLIPQSQKFKIEHYGLGLTPSSECQKDWMSVNSINTQLEKITLKTIVMALYATYQQLIQSHGHNQFWHSALVPTFLKNLDAALEVGYNVPGYESAPHSWVCLKQTDDIKMSAMLGKVYFDESHLPDWFPQTSSFQTIKESNRTAHLGFIGLTPLHIYDLESFFPFNKQELTFNGMEAVIRLICEQSYNKIRETYWEEEEEQQDEEQEKAGPQMLENMGLFFHRLSNLNLPADIDNAQEDYTLNKLIDDKNQLEEQLCSAASHNYIVMILPFFPPGRKKCMEVLVIVDNVQGQWLVIAAQQPSQLIREWNPYEGVLKQGVEVQKALEPFGLVSQLKKMQAYLQLLLPRDSSGFSENKDWTIPETFWRDGTLDGLSAFNNSMSRLVLCRYIDKMATSLNHRAVKHVPWKIGHPLPTQFKINGMLEQCPSSAKNRKFEKLRRLTENYVQLPEQIQTAPEIPSHILSEMNETSVNDEEICVWFKYKYFELIRLKLLK